MHICSYNDRFNCFLFVFLPHPQCKKVSNEFRDLLRRLLAKDPLQRAGWSEALAHPFWSATLPPKDVPLPPEPLYDAMLQHMRSQLPLTEEDTTLNDSTLNDSTLEESVNIYTL
jgi:serine/threonine protein kinase